jgi:two-component system nitrogen regulation response regulator NtrX
MKQRRILVVDDEPEIRRSLAGVLEDEGYCAETAESGEACLDALPGAAFELVLLDIWLPGIDGMEVLERIQALPFAERPVVVVISGHGSIEAAVKATKLGAFDFLEKPLSIDKISVVVKNALAHRAMALENSQLKQDSTGRHRIIGESVPMKALRQQLSLMAATNGRVLIFGESGTGKELVAHALHALSSRAAEAFVEVNCAAIPEELIESELFGHVKGSFTGALEDKTGKFEQAHGGCLFLDEVGDMSLRTQSKVLRVIEEQRFTPVGSGTNLTVDVRIIAATNKHLEDEIQKGNFREDLFYRLNVIPFFVPPLREHAEDIPVLANYFLEEFARAYGRRPKHFAETAMEALSSHRWPGNVRELKNLVERLVIMVQGERIERRHLPPALHQDGPRSSAAAAVKFPTAGFSSLQEARTAYERDYILRTLDEHQGNVSRTAEILGLERSHLYRKMKSLGIAFGS